MLETFKKFLKKNKVEPKSLNEMFAMGFITKEEFLRFVVVKRGISLEKAEQELKIFLDGLKRKKSKRKK